MEMGKVTSYDPREEGWGGGGLWVDARTLSARAWDLRRMLGYQDFTNACDVVLNPNGALLELF